MSKYAKEIVEVLFLLELRQLDSFAKKLNIDEIKILQSEVLPEINDLDFRRQLKTLLTECERNIYEHSSKEKVISSALQQNQKLSDQLKTLYERLTMELVSGLTYDESGKLFLERATEDELFILNRKLLNTHLDEQGKLLKIAVEAEQLRRANLADQPQSRMDSYRDYWRKKHAHPQWEISKWKNIHKNIKQVETEISSPTPVETQVSELIEEQQSWINSIWSSIREFFASFFNNPLRSSPPQKSSISEKDKSPYKIELVENEPEKLEKLRREGARTIAEVTGKSKVGERKRTEEDIERCIMSRFGIVLASQMVAGTKNKNHRDLYTVIESLTLPDDDNATIEKFNNALHAVMPDATEDHPLIGEHACSHGGESELVTDIETEVVRKLVESPENYSQYGLNLSEKENTQLELYHQNMERSRDLNHILRTISCSWGGYEEDIENHSYKKVEKDFDKKQQEFEQNLILGSKALQQACVKLKDGESLYLETGLEGHAMQLVIKKIGHEFKLSTYDSSGALENTSLSNSIWGLIKLFFMGNNTLKKNAYSFSVPQERLISEEGQNYLSTLIRSNSMAGWAQTHIELNATHSTMEERSHMGWLSELLALRSQSFLYSNYLEKFGSLASPEAPPQFEELLQRPQNTQNCFAKKAQSCELYELGKPTYKKFRLAMMLEQREELLNDIGINSGDSTPQFVSKEYFNMLKNIEPEFLSPSELYNVSMRLSEMKESPSVKNYENYFQALIDAREKLAQVDTSDNNLAIQRIDNKIASHAKDYYHYLYLKKYNGKKEIERIFSPAVYSTDPVFNWDSGVMPLKTESNGKINSEALAELSEYATAQAWKASIQLINHQIKKLAVNGRFINSSSERLEHVSYRQASGKVTLTDLENANIVSFTTGFSRKEDVKVEINIGGEHKEIDKATYFKLVVENKIALTTPKVIGLLDYLRNTSPDVEKRYANEVYPEQRKAFKDKLNNHLEKTDKALRDSITRLSQSKNKLKSIIDQSKEISDQIVKDITNEQETIGLGKNSVKLKNLELRLELLKKEREELEKLEVSVSTKIQELKADKKIEGSSEHRIAKARQILAKLRVNDPDLQTVNQVSHAFMVAITELEHVDLHSEKMVKTFEVDEVEIEANDRVNHLNHYRGKVITNHLETNPEYRVLNELSVGRMGGTEKDRNRDLYSQSESERADFFKQGKNTFRPGSVYHEIQRLNQALKAKVNEIIERKVLLSTRTFDASSVDSMESSNDEYINIEKLSNELAHNPIPQEIKEEWVNEMFAIWLKHESPQRLYSIENKNKLDPAESINQAFQHFIEQKTHIKYADLKSAGYPIELNKVQMEKMGWKSISRSEIEKINDHRKKMAAVILKRFKESRGPIDAPSNKQAPFINPIQLNGEDLVTQIDHSLKSNPFVAPDEKFLTQSERETLDGSTLKFLRENPRPVPQGLSKAQCHQFFDHATLYLYKLKAHNGLENKGQRLEAFCHSTAAEIFELPYPPPAALVTEICNSIIDKFRDDGASINNAFLKLENIQRAQILNTLIKLSLSQISTSEAQKTKVDSRFYSTIKQWEKLILPPDAALSLKISMLSPGGSVPADMALLKEVDIALHQSPVGLEGLYEGQKGLQVALASYGEEKGVNAQLRKVADRLAMRNGDALLAHQFIEYYSHPTFLLSSEGINSTQGRELFSRALSDSFQHATDTEKQELLNFLFMLRFDESDACTLKTPHQVFIDEVLIKCSNISPLAFSRNSVTNIDNHHAPETELFIAALTDSSNDDGVDRLFGFAKEINILALRIEHALLKNPVDYLALDALYAKLMCSNLAYQLLLDQVSEDILTSLNHNFEYTKEMSLVQSNINKLQDNLIQFSSNLNTTRITKLRKTLSDYEKNKKFDGLKLGITSPSSTDIPGFISLGNNKCLDVLHGVIYVGNNKLGVMPSYIQAHISLQELGIDNLPFKSQGGGYVYIENNEVKTSISPLSDGNLVIQRELRTLNGINEMLQYIPSEKMESVPISLRLRINAEHFFIDSKGAIHGYDSDFTPVLKLEKQDEQWSGTLLDHGGNKISIKLNKNDDLSPLNELSTIFPYDEMIEVDKNTVYVPSVAKYLICNEPNSYLITDSLTDLEASRELKVTEQGSAYTEKVLIPSEAEEVSVLKEQISELQMQLESITRSDLLSMQVKEKIERKITTCVSRINEITCPEYFVFVPDSVQTKALKEEYVRLRKEMQQAFVDYKDGGKERDKLAANYLQAKKEYLQEKKTLKKAYAGANYLRTYSGRESQLKAKDFHSILHTGLIPNKTQVLIKLLGANVPDAPLKSSELEELRNLRVHYKEKSPLTMDDRFALIMLLGTELQHHVLEREAYITGKKGTWDRKAYNEILEEFSDEVNQVKSLSGELPLDNFSELWRAIQAEFAANGELQQLFTKSVTPVFSGEKKPININTRTTYMPIESLGGRSLVQFKIYENPRDLVDEEQLELEKRLHQLDEYGESIQAQEDGYYYENYGLFNANTLEKLFCVTSEHAGIAGLTKENVLALFTLMQNEKWISPIKDMDKFQLARHPSDFYSSSNIASYLTEIGFDRSAINIISNRLETFLYQTAVSGGRYSIKADHKEELMQKVTEAQDKCNIEYLQVLDKIKSILAKSSSEVTFADLNSAYLLNDYSRIISYFPEEERSLVELALNNSMTRLLYYKTELDHFNDVQNTFKKGQDEKALSMLHVRRNYSLDKLLESELSPQKSLTAETVLQVEQERKMQRAFLLFESEFGHRCNARQVNIFTGLLLDDELNPEKIDSAQARMGFGKTCLLPLVALYKTGEKLVRFVVPKSALETNTSDISLTLTNLVGSRAIKDDFQRYRIEADPEPDMGIDSPRLKSLQDAKADLKKRLSLYKRIKDNREVLVQAPNVRNSMECQAKIFLDMLLKITNEPLQQKELIECISLMNEIRSTPTISIFDELDATQDNATTDVNYTAGEKIPLDTGEIYPLELICETIRSSEDISVGNLANSLLKKFNIADPDRSIFNYITSLQVQQPDSVTPFNSTEIYLMRAVLTDPVMLSVFTEKEAGTDFGVWFQNAKDGTKLYDYDAFGKGENSTSRNPLLIAIPYSAANTPKPQGSRFDNPEVTAITTFLYYLDPRTELNCIPHLEFLIEAFRHGNSEATYLDPSGEGIKPEFSILFNDIKTLAQIEDPIIRNAERDEYFAQLEVKIKKGEIPQTAFRKMLARTVIREQIKFDAGKANSNRYEQGTTEDTVIGFSGTAGDTSSHFKWNMLDPAADGNMTLGIMGRKNCQDTIPLNTTGFTETGENYTTAIVKQLTASFLPDTRVLIDVGGLAKTSNRAVAKEIAIQLKNRGSILKGVIFYDDLTNTKKVLVLDSKNKETILRLTPEMVMENDLKGSYFTYFDQDHSRGANIHQMDKAHAVLTLNFTVTNNDYKQAIMRMRKIVDKALGQSFSIAVPNNVREKIIADLHLEKDHKLTGNDVAFWLRQKELQNNLNNVSLLMMELDSITKNAILQQQAAITGLMAHTEMSQEQITAFRECIRELNDISPFISASANDLKDKYGKVYGTVKKEDFVRDLKISFEKKLSTVFEIVDRTRNNMVLPPVTQADKKAYYDMENRIIQKRELQLSDEFIIPSSKSALSEEHSESESESESQSQSQSQSQTQTHSFSEVTNEEVNVAAQLRKHDLSVKPVSIAYLSTQKAIENLPLASATSSLHNLFNEHDFVKCSPVYIVDSQLIPAEKQPLPPVRYFLAREEGNPKVILINQDEANLFFKAPVSPWSLYDIRFKKANVLVPVTGPAIASLNDSLLKKLNFSSFRYQVTGTDVASLASSFEGIFNPDQLQPSLSIQFEKTENSPEAESIFELSKWGFYGETQQEIELNVQQTKKTFNEKFEKRGVTISLGEGVERADVFISSKLNKHILAETEKEKVEQTPYAQPKLKNIVEQINTAHKVAMKKGKDLREELKLLKDTKSKVTEKYGQQIAALEARRETAISQAKTTIDTEFNLGLKGFLNCQELYEAYLSDCLNSLFCLKMSDSKSFGTKIGEKYFEDLDDAISHCCKELHKQDKNKSLSPNELDKKLSSYIDAISKAMEGRYKTLSCFKERDASTLIEAMYSATLVSATKSKQMKGKIYTIKNDEVKFWSQDLNWTLMYTFPDLRIHWRDDNEKVPELQHKKWNSFVAGMKQEIVDARGKNLPSDVFYQKIFARISKFEKDNNMEVNELKELLVHGLCYSLVGATEQEKNSAALRNDIANIIKKGFLDALTTPSEDQVNLYSRLHNMIKEKIDAHDYELPAILLDYQKAPAFEEVTKAVQQALANQHIRTVRPEVDRMAQECSSYINGRKALHNILDHFVAVENRSGQLDLGGQKCTIFTTNYNTLVKLDTEVLDIQKQIAEAQAQRKAQLTQLEARHQELRVKLEKNKETVKELKAEKSAINKLLSGIKNLLSVFTNHQVAVEEEDPVDFLDTHFDLGTIISRDVSASATLTFMPPELYGVEDDMSAQLIHMHGLEETEEVSKKSFDTAVSIVREEAARVQERRNKRDHELHNMHETKEDLQTTNQDRELNPEVTIFTEGQMQNESEKKSHSIFKDKSLAPAALTESNRQTDSGTKSKKLIEEKTLSEAVALTENKRKTMYGFFKDKSPAPVILTESQRLIEEKTRTEATGLTEKQYKTVHGFFNDPSQKDVTPENPVQEQSGKEIKTK